MRATGTTIFVLAGKPSRSEIDETGNKGMTNFGNLGIDHMTPRLLLYYVRAARYHWPAETIHHHTKERFRHTKTDFFPHPPGNASFTMDQQRQKTRLKLNVSLKPRRPKNLQSQNESLAAKQHDQLVSPSKLHHSPRRGGKEADDATSSGQKPAGIPSWRSQMDDCGDRDRTELRYKNAVKKFEEAIRSHESQHSKSL